MQKRYPKYRTGRQKVRAALLQQGNTIKSLAEKHGLDGSHLSLALTRYLKGEHILPRCPKTYAALREMEEISDVVIMLGAQDATDSKKQSEVAHE